jgi:proteasome lid subunit RPN8/RPN11
MILHQTPPVPEVVRIEAVHHALEAWPRESVGVVVGDGTKERDYVRLDNIHETPEEAFRLSVQDAWNVVADDVLALVHSHPRGPDCPSEHDMRRQESMAKPWGVVVCEEADGKPVFRDMFWLGDQVSVAPLVGRRFRHGVWDCYTLVRDWYRQERGVVLPVFPRAEDWWQSDEDLIGDNMAAAGFDEVDEAQAQAGDVILMSFGSKMGRLKINHLGLYEGSGLMLHHLKDRFSRQEPVEPYRRHHVVRYARRVR